MILANASRPMKRSEMDKLKQRYGDLVCKTRIGETVALATSPMHGLDVFAYGPNSPGAKDYMALTMELMKSGFFDEPART